MCAGGRLFLDGYRAFDALVEGGEGFGVDHPRNFLYAAVEELHQVVGVVGVELDKDGVSAKGVLRFHYFGNLLQFGHHAVVEGALLQCYADVDAHIETELLRVDVEAGALDDADFCHMLHSLVDGGAGYAYLFCDIPERYAGVERDNL